MLNKHDCKSELNDAQLRATPARIALMELFENSLEPLDVQTMIDYLQKRNITADNATVFRIVNAFTQKGLTRQIQLHENKFRYELAARGEHHHLICNVCGKIEDISDCKIEDFQDEISKKKKFVIKSHALEFYGTCNNCQK